MKRAGLVAIAGLGLACLLGGCRTAPPATSATGSTTAATAPTDGGSATTAPADGGTAGRRGEPLAYVNGEAVTRDGMMRPLLEAAGGRVLAELVLNRLVAERLEARGIELSEKQIEAEKSLVLRSLDRDENQSVVLLNQLRRRRGLGDRRFRALLERNAGLRQLVKEQVSVNKAAVRKAYKRRYGPRYEARILVRPKAPAVRRLKGKLADGASFATLAARHSTDPSARQGGLLSPISPVDASYPQVVRETLVKLEPGEVSEVIAVQGGYAVLKLERTIEGEDVPFAEVRDALRQQVRRRLERSRMRQTARSLLSAADVTVLNDALGERWRQHKAQLLQSGS